MSAHVTELWRYPVKSMLGERLDVAEIGKHGVAGDRSFALIDDATGKICSAKRYDLWGDLFRFRASLVQPGLARITFPDGSEHLTDEPDIAARISDVLGRPVTLSTTAPEGGGMYEEVWDPVKGERMYGPATGEEHDGEKVIDVGASFWSQGDFFDAAPLHFITTNTVEAFREREPDTAFDVRRFRPNVVIDVDGVGGFVENDWSVVRVGDVEFRTVMPVPRCVMTTLEQDELPRQAAVLRSAAKHNMVDTGILGKMPCAGIYATVVGEATVSAGDEVTFDTA